MLHGDISEVYLTEGESQKAPIQVKLTNNGFDVSDSQGNLIPANIPINALVAADVTGGGPTSFEPIPDANARKWMLCIKTGVETGQSLSYKVKVKDLRGLPSKTSGNMAKLPVPKISYHSDMGELTEYGVYKDNENALNNDSSSSTNPILISSCFRNPVVLKAYHNDYPNGVTIHAEVKLSASAPAGHSGGTGSSQQDGNTTKILLDPIPGVDEIYEVKVKASASGSNYTDSDEKTYYYQIKKEVRAGTSSWQILKNAVAGAYAKDTIYINGHIKSTNAPNNSGEIEVSKNINIQGLNGKAGDIIDADSKHRIFEIKENKSLTLKNITLKKGKVEGSTYEATGGAIKAGNGSVLTLDNTDIADSEAGMAGGAISSTGNIDIKGNSVIRNNRTISSNGLGGAIYNGGTFKISGPAKITVDSGKNDVYLPMGKVITVTGALTEDSVARISPVIPYTAGRQVVEAASGVTLADKVSKFKVTDGTDGKKWKINTDGKLELANKTITVTTWGELKTEVEKTSEGADVIIVDGTLTAGADSDEIKVKRDVTIKGKDSHAILDANENCRIFKVARNKKLILENLTLQKGDATKSSSEDKNGGAIYLDKKASLEMRSGVIIKDNKAKQGGGIYIGQNAEFLMTGGTIENNIGQGDSHGKAHGGAVYVYGTFKMSGSAKIVPSAAPNENTLGKNDVYLTTGKVITVTGALTQTSVARISPVTPYTAGRQVVEADSGVTLADKVSKFKVTNDPDGKKWKINAVGLLEKDNQGKTVKTWADLKTEVEKPSGGAEVIIVEGTLTAGGASDEIKVKRDVTIKGKDSHAILNADERCRIFKVSNGVTLKLKDITLKKGKEALGVGVYVAEASLELENVIITECKSNSGVGKGGAIYINNLSHNGRLWIKGTSKIEVNGAYNGAGIYINTVLGENIIEGNTEIKGNKCFVSGNGGGIYIEKGNLVLKGNTKIFGNESKNSDTYGGGGGIYIKSGSTLTIKDLCEINNNKAMDKTNDTFTGYGGGICNLGTIIMEGGTITENEAKEGGAVYNNGTFKMSGSAKITPSTGEDEHKKGKNDVYLNNSTLINVNNSLTVGPNQAARITVHKTKYNPSTQVLDGSTTENANKFKVTKKGGQSWYVGNNGKLTTTAPNP